MWGRTDVCAQNSKQRKEISGRHTGLPLRLWQNNSNEIVGAHRCVRPKTHQAKKYRADTSVCPYGNGKTTAMKCRGAPVCAPKHTHRQRKKTNKTPPLAKRRWHKQSAVTEEMRKHKQRKSNSLPLRVLPL